MAIIAKFTIRTSIAVLAAVLPIAFADSAYAALDFETFSGSIAGPDGKHTTQAGSHPDFTTTFRLKTLPDPDWPGIVYADGGLKDLSVDLPPGLVGDPSATPTCAQNDLSTGFNGILVACAPESQVGVADVEFGSFSGSTGVYNIEAPAGAPALFGFNLAGVVVRFKPRLRTGTDYGLSVGIRDTSQALPFIGASVTFWGVPADPVHESRRFVTPGFPGATGVVSKAPRRPFMTLPTRCSTEPLTVSARANSWLTPDVFASRSFNADADGNPLDVDGCSAVPFDATLKAAPVISQAGQPSGYSFDLSIPQNQNPDGLAQAHLRKVVVRLPDGVSISPSSADGLQGCSDAQVALDSADEAQCPEASKIGTVRIDTPLLDKPMDGAVYVGAQASDQPSSGDMFRVFIVASGPGVLVKLKGRVVPDERTGRVTATFDNNPQLPFDNLHVQFKGGPRAPLVNPTTCGTKTTVATLTSWSGKTVESRSSYDVTGCGDPNRFAPTFEAGTVNPLAGAFSPFTMTIRRTDADQDLQGISVNLPSGLLGALSTVPLCGEPQAAAGTCGEASRVGSTTVSAGPGSNPFSVGGKVYLAGPYKGAPFSLSIVVPAKAGPYDLGLVVVRSPLTVDAANAKVAAPSDPLPTILKGVPLKVRMINVILDRPGFTFNATSCAPQQVSATLTSITGRQTQVSSRYQPAGCGDLPLDPKLKLAFTGKGQTKDGTHPGVVADLTQKPGESGLKRVQVTLPLSVALDPENAQALCKPQEAVARACPAGSIIGHATAVTPALHEPLSGPVYFVEAVRKSKSGKTVRTLPKLWLKLEGEGVPLDLWADSSVDSTERLVTTFSSVPDAPITSFHMTIDGGKHGVLAANSDVCARSKTTDVSFDGQSGTTVDRTITVAVPDCGLAIAKTTTTNSAVTLRVTGLSAGNVSVSGRGVGRSSKSIKEADVASLTARLTKRARHALSRDGKVRVHMSVAFTAKGAKKAKTVTKTVTVKHKNTIPNTTTFG